jgi:hypothetical protein
LKKSKGNKEVKIMAKDGKAVAFEKTTVSENGSQSENGLQSAAVTENRLDAIRVLSNSILREVEALVLEKANGAVLPSKIDLSEEVQRLEKDLIRCALLRTGGDNVRLPGC